MTLQQLFKGCKQQSIKAQKCLYERYADQMFILCRRYVKDDCIAEEMVMNGFLKFFRSLNSFEYVNDAAAVGFLRKMMVNECLMQLRSSHSFLQVATDEFPELAADDNVISEMSADEIFKLIIQLPTGYRTVFNLYVIEGMTHKEIAGLLQISEGTSKSQLSKGKQMLQLMLIKNNAEYGCRKTK